MSELAKRVLTSLVGIPIVLLFLFIPNGLWWALFVTLLAFLCIGELASVWEQCNPGSQINPMIALIGALLPLDAWFRMNNMMFVERYETLVGTLLILSAIGYEVWIADRTGHPSAWKNIGSAAMITLYVGVLFRLWVLLHGASLQVGSQPAVAGHWVVLLVFLSIWASDTFAYFGGKRFGRRRLSPHLSPRKSWEGAYAGCIGAVIIAVAASLVMQSSVWPTPVLISWPLAAIIGLLASIAGVVGDLFESSLKREIGVKDSGNLLPGHGGILDRFDSLMLAVPAIYVALQVTWLLRF